MSTETVTLRTRLAHWGWEDHRYFGHSVFGELCGRESLAGLTALSVCGHRISAEACAVLDDAAVALTLADPRIWPLKVTRLLAAYGGTVTAAACGLLILDGARVGPWAIGQAGFGMAELHARLGGRLDDDEFVRHELTAYLEEHGILWGFGTPFREHDERMIAFRRCLEQRGRTSQPHWRTLEAIAKAALSLRSIAANIGAGFAAACLDLGLSPSDVGPLATALMQHMFFANAVEGKREDQRRLRKLPDQSVEYVGHERRVSPRAQRPPSAAGPARECDSTVARSSVLR